MEVWHDGSQNHHPLQQESLLKLHKYSEGNDKSSVIGTVNPSWAPEFISDFIAVRVVFCVLFYRSLLILLCGLFFIGRAAFHVFPLFVYICIAVDDPVIKRHEIWAIKRFNPSYLLLLSREDRVAVCQNCGCPPFIKSNLLILISWHNTQRTTHIKN